MAHRNHFKDYRKSKNINTSTDYIERVQSYYYKNENASSNLKSNQNNEVLQLLKELGKKKIETVLFYSFIMSTSFFNYFKCKYRICTLSLYEFKRSTSTLKVSGVAFLAPGFKHCPYSASPKSLKSNPVDGGTHHLPFSCPLLPSLPRK